MLGFMAKIPAARWPPLSAGRKFLPFFPSPVLSPACSGQLENEDNKNREKAMGSFSNRLQSRRTIHPAFRPVKKISRPGVVSGWPAVETNLPPSGFKKLHRGIFRGKPRCAARFYRWHGLR
jgi:hypothetical protein